MSDEKAAVKTPKEAVDRFKAAVYSPSVQEQFKNALADNTPLFMASLIDIYSNDRNVRECEPAAVIMEALKAATLKLPINKQLGFAYIVAYKKVPAFQMGYKGYVQLAIRSGQYRYLNMGIIYAGQTIEEDLLTGKLTIAGQKQSEEAIGYFAYLELLNGYSKAIAWSKDQVKAHAKRFSKNYGNPNSTWTTNFDAMAKKTMIRNLLSKYGIMSIEMSSAYVNDEKELPTIEGEFVDLTLEEGTDVGTVTDVTPPASEEAPY